MQLRATPASGKANASTAYWLNVNHLVDSRRLRSVDFLDEWPDAEQEDQSAKPGEWPQSRFPVLRLSSPMLRTKIDFEDLNG